MPRNGSWCLVFSQEASPGYCSSSPASLLAGSSVAQSFGHWICKPHDAHFACGNPRRPEFFPTRDFRPAGLLLVKTGNSSGVTLTQRGVDHDRCHFFDVRFFRNHHQPPDHSGARDTLKHDAPLFDGASQSALVRQSHGFWKADFVASCYPEPQGGSWPLQINSTPTLNRETGQFYNPCRDAFSR